MAIGDRIKAARKRAGMTQKDLADRLEVSHIGVSQWESGRRNPKQSMLPRIADVLDVPLSRLTGTRSMSDDELFDAISRAWSHANYQATILQQQEERQEEVEQWERICDELCKLNDEIVAEYRTEREKLSEREEELLKIFRWLNFDGQRKILAIAADYAEISKYLLHPGGE